MRCALELTLKTMGAERTLKTTYGGGPAGNDSRFPASGRWHERD